MAKPKTYVDEAMLRKAIETVEANGPLPTQVDVWQQAAVEYNKTAKVQITPSVVMLRATKEFNIEIKTPSARGKGRAMSDAHKAALLGGRGQRVKKAEKFEQSEVAQAAIERLLKDTPARFHPLVESIKAGSRSAAVKLHCLACLGYSTGEVRNCTGVTCPLFLFRPYQGSLEPEEQEQVEQEQESETVEV